jgi:hypothetical protein
MSAEKIVHEFDCQALNPGGNPTGEVYRVYVAQGGRRGFRFTTREPDGGLELGSLQLGTEAAKEIARLAAALERAKAEAREELKRELLLIANEITKICFDSALQSAVSIVASRLAKLAKEGA